LQPLACFLASSGQQQKCHAAANVQLAGKLASLVLELLVAQLLKVIEYIHAYEIDVIVRVVNPEYTKH